MEMKTKRKLSVAVTATLAELYEKQQHYFAAYIVYWLLNQKEGGEKYRGKLESVKRMIYQNEGEDLKYEPIIKELFDEEELRSLNVLPKQKYLEYVETLSNLQKDEDEELDSISEEEANLGRIGQVIGNEWKKFVEEVFTANKQLKKEVKNKTEEQIDELAEIKLSDFLAYLVHYEKSGEKLSEVRLAELMSKFLEKYSEKLSYEE